MTKLVQGIGTVGVGEHKPSIGGKKTKEYDSWRSIMRMVSENSELSVSDDWKNFQSYANWYCNQHKEDGWVMSKDVILKGNTHYSSELCTFVPNDIQRLITLRKGDRGDLPVGVAKNRDKFSARNTVDGKMKVIGTFPTPEQAFYAYKDVKEKQVKEMADTHKSLLSESAYNGLINWSVDITD